MKKAMVCMTVVLGTILVPNAIAGGEGRKPGKTRSVDVKTTPAPVPTPAEFLDAPPPDVQDALMDMPAGDPAEITKLRKQQEEEEERKRLKDNAEWEAKKKKRP